MYSIYATMYLLCRYCGTHNREDIHVDIEDAWRTLPPGTGFHLPSWGCKEDSAGWSFPHVSFCSHFISPVFFSCSIILIDISRGNMFICKFTVTRRKCSTACDDSLITFFLVSSLYISPPAIVKQEKHVLPLSLCVFEISHAAYGIDGMSRQGSLWNVISPFFFNLNAHPVHIEKKNSKWQ